MIFMNRRIIFLLAVFFACGLTAFSQSQDDNTPGQRLAFGVGPEMNMNSRENFAFGGNFHLDFNIGSSCAAGLTVTVSHNFDDFTVIEPSALFRWYFLGKNQTGLFVQADVGVYMFFDIEGLTPMFGGGLRGGLRIPLGDIFYIEPYGRIGYPFAFGVGATAGLRL